MPAGSTGLAPAATAVRVGVPSKPQNRPPPLRSAVTVPLPVALVPSKCVTGTNAGAMQLAVPPPPEPPQDHNHGPVPPMTLGVPDEHRPVAGAAMADTPLAAPQLPLTCGWIRRKRALTVQFAFTTPVVYWPPMNEPLQPVTDSIS